MSWGVDDKCSFCSFSVGINLFDAEFDSIIWRVQDMATDEIGLGSKLHRVFGGDGGGGEVRPVHIDGQVGVACYQWRN